MLWSTTVSWHAWCISNASEFELTCLAVVSVAFSLEMLSTRTSRSKMFCVIVSKLLATSLAVSLAWQLLAYAAARARRKLYCMVGVGW
jgi:hypothetical protein